MSIFSKMTSIANKIRSLTGVTTPLTLDDMSDNLGEVNSDVNGQTDLIAQIAAALEGKAADGGIDTSDATATADDILIGKTAYVNGNKITGNYEGVELNFDVVGSTTQPSNPTENMIWVNTSTEITDWIFSATQPTAASGRVWIYTGISSKTEFNTLTKNGIQVCPISAKQYVSGAWVDKTAKSYQNGEWVEWIPVLYKPGIISGFTGIGWKSKSSETTVVPTITYNADNMVVSIQSSVGSDTGVAHTSKKYDLTNVKTVKLVLSNLTGQPYNGHEVLAVWSSVGSGYYIANAAAYYLITNTGAQTVTLDVSTLNGEYYIGVGGRRGSYGCVFTIASLELFT